MTTEALTAKLKELAKVRHLQDVALGTMTGLEAIVQATPQWKQFQEAKNTQRELADMGTALQDSVRELTMAAYQETGEVKPVDGVHVKEYTVIDYPEPKAFDYCLAELHDALALNRKTFEKVVQALPEERRPEFVTVKKEPRATIAADLSFLLEESNG